MATKTESSTKPNVKKKAAEKEKAVKAENNTEKFQKDYNAFKEFHGQKYTGMKIGRSHKWNYDKGVWKETKVTPDLWEFHFSVTKRRAGHAPEGSGAPVGTDYHWYILADQNVEKLDANSYSTDMKGLKFKIAHKRANNDKWSLSEKGQLKKLIKILQSRVKDLEDQLEEM